MFYEPKTLIIVYKDEMLANQMKKLIETKNGSEKSSTRAMDDNINIVTWTEKVWLANKKAGNLASKILFLGNIKGVESLIPVVDVKFEKHGVRFGWASNQAIIYVEPNEIKSINSYLEFHTELEALPVPQMVKDSIRPKYTPNAKSKAEDFSSEKQCRKGVAAQFKRARNVIGNAMVDIEEKAHIFSEENFKNKKAMTRQMLFFGVIQMYNNGLETFMNS